MTEGKNTPVIKPCPMCGDAMKDNLGQLEHVEQGQCILGGFSWPIEWADRWNTRADDLAEIGILRDRNAELEAALRIEAENLADDIRWADSCCDLAALLARQASLETALSKTERNAPGEATDPLREAAPELLRLAKLVQGSFGGGLVMTFSELDVEEFEAAIAKAEGKS
ncbi:hypothetical protein DYI37_03330 [Fulvimarina endophytica]|uniref:Uncharacterized protein n=1 Tax=Fulvimarina endophytica TaxID=2293836 RepID=A0A371XB73_9HYPH|nr:hypothetical protein [Fulvimarina endophytica]RFC66488.1 hypothetical protein DYI37_03330 [Fulvimarina endophytica]